jgi:hypothetical protein
MEVSYARINFELPAADCTEALVGVSIPVKNEALELCQKTLGLTTCGCHLKRTTLMRLR